MPRDSTFLPWPKILGSALLLGSCAHMWLFSLGFGTRLGLGDPRSSLAASLLVSGFLLWFADRAGFSGLARASFAAILALGAAAVLGAGKLVGVLPSTALAWAQATLALGAAVLLWQRNRSPEAWHAKVLWAFALTAIPPFFPGLFAAAESIPIPPLALTMVLGVTVCLGEERLLAIGNPWKRVLSAAFLVFLAGWFFSVLSPGASLAASWGLRGLWAAFGELLLMIAKPVGYGAGFLIDAIRRYLARKGMPDEEAEFQWARGEEPPGETEILPDSKVASAIGWVLAGLLVVLVLWAAWAALGRYAEKRPTAKDEDETRKRDRSLGRTASWAKQKAKELASPLLHFLGSRRGQDRPADPLVAAYQDFLDLAASLGHPRPQSMTPMEFSCVLSQSLGECAPQIQAISLSFTANYYSKEPSSSEEVASMLTNLEVMKAAVLAPR